MQVLTTARSPRGPLGRSGTSGYTNGWPLIAADSLPCMPVLTTAPPPHRYTNEANRDAIREAGAIPLLLGLLDQVR